jgi:GNAT superfamily N-acetyltransferase
VVVSDLGAVEGMWRRCGEETRARRFLGGRGEASWLLGVRTTRAVPRVEMRVDLGAWVGRDLVGLGSMVCAGGGVWELAMVVEDAWQGRGVGGRLADGLLAEATAYGVRSVTLTTPVDAPAVIRLLRPRVATVRLVWCGSGVAEYRADLVPGPAVP